MNGAFFVASGLVVVAENAVKGLLKLSGYLQIVERLVPAWIRVLYTLTTLFVLGHFLFWPELHAVKVGNVIADVVIHSLKLA